MRDSERIYAAFPHQLGGGLRQRIALAQAQACQSAPVIADEPTAFPGSRHKLGNPGTSRPPQTAASHFIFADQP